MNFERGSGVLTYHHAAREGDTSSTVRVGNNVPVTYAEESNGDQPHGV